MPTEISPVMPSQYENSFNSAIHYLNGIPAFERVDKFYDAKHKH